MQSKGFSLLECLVVLLVIGLLAAMAYPSFNGRLLKAHRAEAWTALLHTQLMLERCWAESASYNGRCKSLTPFPHQTAQGHYQIYLSSSTDTAYTLTAAAIGAQRADITCTVLWIDEKNERGGKNQLGVAESGCWDL